MAGFSEFYTSFPQFVKDGLKERASRDFVAEPRNAWIRMTSNFKTEDGERKVLMGGDMSEDTAMPFGYDQMYEAGGRIPPKRPVPGITDVSIDVVNKNFKAITVNWKTYSIDQLDRLMPFFMNPGITVLLEVGWSDIGYGHVIDPFDEEKVSKFYGGLNEDSESGESNVRNYKQHERFKTMRGAQGDYYVFPGMLNDFNFSMNQQGGFDCTTKLQSVTESTFTLSSRTSGIPRTKDANESKTLLQLINEEIEFAQPNLGSGRSSDENDPKKAEGGQTFPTTQKIGENFYYSWGQIEEVFNQAYKLKHEETNAEDFELFRFNSVDSKVSYFRGEDSQGETISLKSTDLDVCLINGGKEDFNSADKFKVKKFDKEKNVNGHKLTDEEKGNTGWLYHLFITTEIFKRAVEKNNRVTDAIHQMLSECNEVCHNIWDWEILVEDETNTATVIDRNHLFSRAGGDLNAYPFDVFSKTSNVRDISISSDLNDNVVQMASAQNLARANSEKSVRNDESDVEGQLFDRYKGRDVVMGGLSENDEAKKQGSQLEGTNEVDSEDSPESNATWQLGKSDKTTLSSIPKFVNETLDLSSKREDQFKKWKDEKFVDHVYATAYEMLSLRPLLVSSKSELSSMNGNAIMDLDLTITITGMAGIRRYQVFDIKHLPKFLRENGVFTVTSVSHSIQGNDWTTQIEAKYVVGNMFKKNVNDE